MNATLSDPLFIRLVITALLIGLVIASRYIVGRWIRRDTSILQEHQRQQFFYLRTAITVGLAFGLIMIWGGHLQNMLLSLTAVMVAVVIATKELIMCLSGFMMRATGQLFAIGDWIECDGLHGEVTDHTLLSTTMLEVGNGDHGYSYTGRHIVLPNSLFLSKSIRASRFERRFVLHRFTITLDSAVHVQAAIEQLVGAAEAACAPFATDARQYNDMMDHRLGVDIPGPEPVVRATTSDIGKPRFSVTLFAPTGEARSLEHTITTDFLAAIQDGTVPPVPAAAAPAP